MITKGKKVLITGASRGLGLDLAIRFKELGYTTILLSRERPPCRYDKWIEFDFSSSEMLSMSLISRQIDNDIDIFIANAGMLPGLSPQSYDYTNILKIFNVNFAAHIVLCNYLIEHMEKRNFGRIVFIGSTAAETGHPDIMYGATKAAIANASLSYAKLYEDKDITVNCIQPGAMKTSITKDMTAKNKAFLGHHTLIAGPYLEIDKVIDMSIELVADSNAINGAMLTIGANSVWRGHQ